MPARVAAVQPLDANWNRVRSRTRQPWQQRARFFAENLGLIRFSNGMTSQTCARCDLRVEKLVDISRREWEPVENEPEVSDLLATYTGPDADSARDLVSRHVWHYQTTGECFQVVDQDEITGEMTWSIRSTMAVDFRSDYAIVMDLPGGSIHDGSAHRVPIEWVRRLWVPDPEWSLRAISPLKGVLSDCERYWALARRIRREAESVLTNGLLFTPEYAHGTKARQPIGPGDHVPSKLDLEYLQAAQMAFTDDDSVQAIAALPMHYGPGDTQRDPMAPQFIYPGMDLSGNGLNMRKEAMEAIAQGLDMPKSVATGDGANHWSEWLHQESYINSSVAPIMDRVCHNDITLSFLRPVLAAKAQAGMWNGDPRLYRIGYDYGPVVVHPDRGPTAIQLFPFGLVKAAVVLEANGLNASDQPDAFELAEIIRTLTALPHRGTQGPGANDGANPISVTSRNTTPVGPSTVKEMPPAPAMAALMPYECESVTWFEDFTPARTAAAQPPPVVNVHVHPKAPVRRTVKRVDGAMVMEEEAI